MYIVYDPNHRVKMISAGPRIALVHIIEDMALDGEKYDDVSWNDFVKLVSIFTHKGVYTIEHVEVEQWIMP